MTTATRTRAGTGGGSMAGEEITVGDDLKARREKRLKPFDGPGAVDVEQFVHEPTAPDAAAHDALLRGIDVVGMKVADDRLAPPAALDELLTHHRHGQAAKISAGADGRAQRAVLADGDGEFVDSIDGARGGAELRP